VYDPAYVLFKLARLCGSLRDQREGFFPATTSLKEIISMVEYEPHTTERSAFGMTEKAAKQDTETTKEEATV